MFGYTDSFQIAIEKAKRKERLKKEAYNLFKQVVEEVDKNDKSGNPIRLSDVLKD